MSVKPVALAQATDRFVETLEEKWRKERESHSKGELQDSLGRESKNIPAEVAAELQGTKGEDAGALDELVGVRGKTERLISEQPQDGTNTFADGETLEPVIATKGGLCSICKSYIERGESIVSADGTAWVHTVCALQQSWPIASDT